MKNNITFKELKELFTNYAQSVHNNDRILHSTKHNDRTAEIKWTIDEITNKYNGETFKGYVIKATHKDGEPLKREYKQVANALKKAIMDKLKDFGLIYELMWATNENGFNYRVNAYNVSKNSEIYTTDEQRKQVKKALENAVKTMNAKYNIITELHLLQVEYEKTEHKKEQNELTYDRRKSYYYQTTLTAYNKVLAFYQSERKKADKEKADLQKIGEKERDAKLKAKAENEKVVAKAKAKAIKVKTNIAF